MKISVIVPTKNREARLRVMYRCFSAQTWKDRELLILDDSPQPSVYFSSLNDPLVTYRHLPQPLILGEKRNRMVSEAHGDLIAHFDDDDFYAPNYLEQMVALRGDADFFTLSGWFTYVEKYKTYWYWDTEQVLPYRYAVNGRDVPTPQVRPAVKDTKDRRVDLDLWGYGFSYLYTRALGEKIKFPAVGFGEDHAFATRAAAAGAKRAYAPDNSGLSLHVLHGSNSSLIFPQYALPPFAARSLFGKWLEPLLAPAT